MFVQFFLVILNKIMTSIIILKKMVGVWKYYLQLNWLRRLTTLVWKNCFRAQEKQSMLFFIRLEIRHFTTLSYIFS